MKVRITGPGISAMIAILVLLLCNEPIRAGSDIGEARRIEDFPAKLSQTGLFQDVQSSQLVDGFHPYQIIVPFWSDGADKGRWMRLPKGGKIQLSSSNRWTFPVGTTFVKDFEIASERLETRVIVYVGAGEVIGAAYKWRKDKSDADLVKNPLLEKIPANEREWYYPGVQDCRACHTPFAGGILGVRPEQISRNLMVKWKDLFEAPVTEQEPLHRLMPPFANDGTLQERARSYLDANCSHCHRPGGTVANFDARITTPFNQQNILEGPVLINQGIDRARVVASHDPWRSILLVRAQTLEPLKMPPLAHQMIDERGVKLLHDWIESLPGPEVLAPPAIVARRIENAFEVKLTHTNPKVEIHYTLDGLAPDKKSTLYAGPIVLTNSATVRARVYHDGAMRSVINQQTLILETN